MIIETDRLTLRPFTMDDLDALAVIHAKPEVMKYIRDGMETHAETVAELQTYIQHYEQHGFSKCAMLHRADARLIGVSGLMITGRTPEPELSCLLDQPYWSQGLALEAPHAWLRYGFEELGLAAIAAIAYPENRQAHRALENLGLTYCRTGLYGGHECRYYRIEKKAFKPLAKGYRVLPARDDYRN